MNAWTHLAVVRKSGTITFYVDGVSNGYALNRNSQMLGNKDFWWVGAYASSLIETLYKGYISGLRIKPLAFYNENFKPL